MTVILTVAVVFPARFPGVAVYVIAPVTAVGVPVIAHVWVLKDNPAGRVTSIAHVETTPVPHETVLETTAPREYTAGVVLYTHVAGTVPLAAVIVMASVDIALVCPPLSLAGIMFVMVKTPVVRGTPVIEQSLFSLSPGGKSPVLVHDVTAVVQDTSTMLTVEPATALTAFADTSYTQLAGITVFWIMIVFVAPSP